MSRVYIFFLFFRFTDEGGNKNKNETNKQTKKSFSLKNVINLIGTWNERLNTTGSSHLLWMVLKYLYYPHQRGDVEFNACWSFLGLQCSDHYPQLFDYPFQIWAQQQQLWNRIDEIDNRPNGCIRKLSSILYDNIELYVKWMILNGNMCQQFSTIHIRFHHNRRHNFQSLNWDKEMKITMIRFAVK